MVLPDMERKGLRNMITVFNRKELLITYSMKEQAEVKQMLEEHNIKYHVRVVDRKSPSIFSPGSRAYTGTYGENLEQNCQYTIYVKKTDYENARSLLGPGPAR